MWKKNLSKAKWRMEYMRDPQKCLCEHFFNGKEREQLLKKVVMKEVRAASFFQRFQQIISKKALDVDYWMLKRLRKSEDDKLYFDFGERKIFFEPDYEINDRSLVIAGALHIMKEAYLWGSDFFSKEVHVSPGDMVLDFGGNLGTSAMLFSSLTGPKGHVFSFEPVHHQALRRNLKENRISNVTVIAAAVGDKMGEIGFSLTDLGIDARITTQDAARTLKVPMITIDEFVKTEGISKVGFTKFDIEGAEEMAIRGGRKVFCQHRPKCTIASYHTDPQGDPQHPKLKKLLQHWRYRINEVSGKHLYAW